MSVDFDALIAQAVDHKVLDNYPKPLNKPLKGWAKPITYPGGAAYNNGPYIIEWRKIDLPQGTVDAHHRSAKEMLNHLMPAETLNKFMKEYFAGNFLQDPHFKFSLQRLILPKERRGVDAVPFAYTRNLEATDERKHIPRTHFTNAEFEINRQICERHPELPVTIIAYHAALSSYLDQYRQAITDSRRLDDDQKTRFLEQSQEITDATYASLFNIMGNYIPAIALHYDRRVAHDYKKPFADDDFKKGMQWLYDLNVFKNTVESPTGESRHFTCPAQGMLMRSSALDLNSDSTAPNYAKENYGTLMAGICQKTQTLLAENSAVKREIEKMVKDACAQTAPKF